MGLRSIRTTSTLIIRSYFLILKCLLTEAYKKLTVQRKLQFSVVKNSLLVLTGGRHGYIIEPAVFDNVNLFLGYVTCVYDLVFKFNEN